MIVTSDHIYDQDNLRTLSNHEFMNDAEFKRAYARGCLAVGADYNWHWRVHVGLWAARLGALLRGDFVERGVNRGFLSSAIMELLNWNETGRMFYLLDTFAGLDERYISDEEAAQGIMLRNKSEIESGFYVTSAETVRKNFSEWHRTQIIEGSIPETLPQVSSTEVAFLHIDLNCSPPEVAALEFFWDKLVPGAPVLLDDYAYFGYRSQKLGADGFALRKGVAILSLPTGQGLIIKPWS